MTKFKAQQSGVLLLLFVAVLFTIACTKKKEEAQIVVVEAVAPPLRNDTTSLPHVVATPRFLWDGKYYDAIISRQTAKDRALVLSTEGNKYYDNSVSLTINGGAGTLFRRTFYKEDFAPYIDTNYLRPEHSTLTDISFVDVTDGVATFFASIGSPDERDDMYMLVAIHISQTGQMTMERVEDLE